MISACVLSAAIIIPDNIILQQQPRIVNLYRRGRNLLILKVNNRCEAEMREASTDVNEQRGELFDSFLSQDTESTCSPFFERAAKK